MYNNAK